MLEKINKPEDLKKLNIKEKEQLASEIRNYLIDVVSENGGHLASNLGVVELTIALNSIFDFSKDKIVWDVGHQTYVYKILTGRKEQLKSIRKLNGIAGFPKTNESEYDHFNTGHSSTSISAAMGMAKARDIKKESHYVMAVIGDGALTGGMALEALNHVGSSKTKVLIILNDNEMSISKNIGGINMLLSKLRSRKSYTESNKTWKKVIRKIPIIGKKTVKIIQRTKQSIKQLIIPKMFFEDIGFKYLGPVDGHNIEDLEILLDRAKDLDEPVIIHVLTKKGKGYKYAEENPDRFHAISSFNKEDGMTKSKKAKDYSAVFGENLIKMAEKNSKIVAVTAAMKDGTGLAEFANKYPDRFFDVGIAEQHAITFAAGLAKEGMVPFIPIYSSFYQRAYDQVIHDVAMQNLPVIMCVDRSGIVGADGETHQGIFDMSFFKIVPNLTIVVPKNFDELESMMKFAETLNKPIVIRYPRGGESKQVFNKNEEIILGEPEVLQEGKDVIIIAIGNQVAKAMMVAARLKKIHIEAEVINVRFLKPLNEEKISKLISRIKFVITIEDSTIIGGLGSTIEDIIVKNNLEGIRLKSFAYPDVYVEHGSVEELEKLYKIDEETIYEFIQSTLNKNDNENVDKL